MHAAGNVISLKLIVEDKDIVQKINHHLSPQIRVWGYERTSNGFSAYQSCDSRIYEYLIPTHSFLPPHPNSYIGKKIAESAKANGDEDGWLDRQEEVADFWGKIDAEHIKPILESYDDDSRKILEKALYLKANDIPAEMTGSSAERRDTKHPPEPTEKPEAACAPLGTKMTQDSLRNVEELLNRIDSEVAGHDQIEQLVEDVDDDTKALLEMALLLRQQDPTRSPSSLVDEAAQSAKPKHKKQSHIGDGIKRLRAAYVMSKRSYRIPKSRLERIRMCLAMYEGTKNYHNFTIDKSYRDPSAKRVIKSFVVNPEPILINGTEWLSLKVHGQSFMMHQIRKMVGMVALVVRCGCDPNRILEAYRGDVISIPKAPSLGLLLERPVFDSYNKRATSELGKEALDFGKYEKEMEEFKQRDIYEKIYRDEETNNM